MERTISYLRDNHPASTPLSGDEGLRRHPRGGKRPAPRCRRSRISWCPVSARPPPLDVDADGTLAANSDARVPSQKAVKTYIDGLAANVGKRGRARAATTVNITISTALNNGDTLDGRDAGHWRFWCWSKTRRRPARTASMSSARHRRAPPEYDAWDEFPGSLLGVAEGSTNGDTIWLCTSNAGGTLDTTAIAFTQLRVAGELLASDIGVTVQAIAPSSMMLQASPSPAMPTRWGGGQCGRHASRIAGGVWRWWWQDSDRLDAQPHIRRNGRVHVDPDDIFRPGTAVLAGSGATEPGRVHSAEREVSTDNFATTVPGYDPVYIAGGFWDQTVNALSGVIRIANYNGAVVLLDGAYGEDNGVGGSSVSPLAAHISAPINAGAAHRNHERGLPATTSSPVLHLSSNSTGSHK